MIQRGTELGQSELGACSAHLANSWAALFCFLLTQQIEDLGFSFRKFIQRSIIAPQSHRIGVWFFTAFTTIKESSSKITLSALYVSINRSSQAKSFTQYCISGSRVWPSSGSNDASIRPPKEQAREPMAITA
jgi:hypothetical protein